MTEKNIHLVPLTKDNCHAFYKMYVADPMMTTTPFVYDAYTIDLYYETKVTLPDRRYFSIFNGEDLIGEIQLKGIDFEKREATMSVILSCDAVKNKGYGTEAERQLIRYGLQELQLLKIKADTVKRNVRSRHVLEKLGFKYIGEDEILDYFELIL